MNKAIVDVDYLKERLAEAGGKYNQLKEENEKLKSLLTKAIEDLQELEYCDNCVYYCDYYHKCYEVNSCNYKWKYADEFRKVCKE